MENDPRKEAAPGRAGGRRLTISLEGTGGERPEGTVAVEGAEPADGTRFSGWFEMIEAIDRERAGRTG